MRWSYKTVHYDLQKEGLLGNAFLDESEVELSLNEYGKAGWELVSILETQEGLLAVFKQPIGLGQKVRFDEEELPPSRPEPPWQSEREAEEEPAVPASTADLAPVEEYEIVVEEGRGREAPEKDDDDIGSIRIE